MALPQTLLNDLVEGGLGFAIDVPPYAFIEYNGRWFYVRGFDAALQELKQRIGSGHPQYQVISTDLVKGYKPAAVLHATTHWAPIWPNGDWRRCSSPQINSAKRVEPMRFDKAWMAVASLGSMCEAVEPNFDWQAYIKICPATYLVEGFDLRVLDLVKKAGDLENLRDYSFQLQGGALNELALNRAVTFRTAARVSEFLNEHDYGPTRVVLATNPDKRSDLEDIIHVTNAGGMHIVPKKQVYRMKPARE